MNVQFYFDPSCPWCWITSRWLTEVQTHRDVNIEWLPFSLALKNDELTGKDSTEHAESHKEAHKVLQAIEVMLEVDKSQDWGTLYTEFGKRHFVDGRKYSDIDIEEIIKASDVKIDKQAAQEAIESYDDMPLHRHLQNAINVVGDDVGVPLIIFENENGEKQGYFGPVLAELPNTEAGLDLWDGLFKLATSEHFFELKRTRSSGPKPESTKRLF